MKDETENKKVLDKAQEFFNSFKESSWSKSRFESSIKYYEASQEEITTIESQIKSNETELAELNKTKSDLVAKLAPLKSDHSSFEQLKTDLEQKNNELTSKIADEKRNTKKLYEQKSSFERKISNLQGSKKNLETDKSDLDEDITRQKEANDKLEQKISELKNKNDELESGHDQKIEQAKQQGIEESNQIWDNRDEEINVYHKRLLSEIRDDSEQKINDAQNITQQLEKENEKLGLQLKKIQEEGAKTKQNNEALQANLQKIASVIGVNANDLGKFDSSTDQFFQSLVNKVESLNNEAALRKKSIYSGTRVLEKQGDMIPKGLGTNGSSSHINQPGNNQEDIETRLSDAESGEESMSGGSKLQPLPGNSKNLAVNPLDTLPDSSKVASSKVAEQLESPSNENINSPNQPIKEQNNGLSESVLHNQDKKSQHGTPTLSSNGERSKLFLNTDCNSEKSSKTLVGKQRHRSKLKMYSFGAAAIGITMVAVGLGASGTLALSSPIMIATIAAAAIALLIFISTVHAYRRVSNQITKDDCNLLQQPNSGIQGASVDHQVPNQTHPI